MSISEIIHLLETEYGPRDWQPHHDPTSELILTILSQNTSAVNTRRAFDRLRATFDSWEATATSDVGDISASIRSGGLAEVKARRIKLILQQLEEQCSLDLGFLASLPLEEAKAWLKRLPGVGPKTAGCVLLFSLGRPALPVDTHVYRVSRRLGMINSRVSPEQAHQVLEGMIPPQSIYQFHLQMVEHGRRICKSRRPLCQQCVLGKGCPTRS